MSVDIDRNEQIKAILLGANIGYTGWIKKNLSIPSASALEKFKFEDLFNIKERDVYDFIKEYGWNYFYLEFQELQNLVDSYNELPDVNTKFAKWLILPTTFQGLHLAQFNSFDRQLWNEWYFSSEKERDMFIVKQMFLRQKTLWKT